MRRQRVRPQIDRRQVLAAGGALAFAATLPGCSFLSTDPSSERDGATGDKPAGKAAGEAPGLRELVEQGKLPPLRRRLPKNPLVVRPVDRVGSYGGQWRNALIGPGDAFRLVYTLAYENLVRWDLAWKQVVPNVAASFSASSDGRRFRFTLREGMRWSDGKPFTVEDIRFAFEDGLLDKDVSPEPPPLFVSGDKPGQLHVVDDKSFEFEFEVPNGLFLERMASDTSNALTRLPRHHLAKYHKKHSPGADKAAKDAGYEDGLEALRSAGDVFGAFWQDPKIPRLHAWLPRQGLGTGTRLVFERNPYYWKTDPEGNQLPYLDGVTFDLVQDPELLLLKVLHGEIDMIDRHINTTQNKPVLAREREKAGFGFFDLVPDKLNTMTIMLNLTSRDPVKRELFRSKDFRIGLSYAIDREQIIRAVHARQGEPWQVAPSKGSEFFDEEMAKQYTEYDVDLANQHLDRAGLTERDGGGLRLGPDGKPVRFTVMVGSGAGKPHLADSLELVRGYWREVGIAVAVKPEDLTLFGERQIGQPDRRRRVGRRRRTRRDPDADLLPADRGQQHELRAGMGAVVPVRRRVRRGAAGSRASAVRAVRPVARHTRCGRTCRADEADPGDRQAGVLHHRHQYGGARLWRGEGELPQHGGGDVLRGQLPVSRCYGPGAVLPWRARPEQRPVNDGLVRPAWSCRGDAPGYRDAALLSDRSDGMRSVPLPDTAAPADLTEPANPTSSLRPTSPAPEHAGRVATQPAYRLVRRTRVSAAMHVSAPTLDDTQRWVVHHRGGPLLVLAGPGTGKTTTLVEAAVDRIERDGLDPAQVLLLTFSRRAAAELRDRIAARLGRTIREPLARTFHSYAFGLLRGEAVLHDQPMPRLLAGPEQDLLIRDLLRGDVEEFGATSWPALLRPALLTRGFAQELRDLLLRAAERGLDPRALSALGRRNGRDDWVAAARFARQYTAVTALRPEAPAYDPAELVRAAVDLLRADADLLAREREARAVVFVDEYQDTDPAQEELLSLLAGGGRDLVVVGDPDQSIYAFRGAEIDGIRRFTERFPRADGQEAATVALHRSRRAGRVLLDTSRRFVARLGGPPRHRRLTTEDGVPPGEVQVHLLRSENQEAAFVAQRLREAHLVDGVPWSRMAVLVRAASYVSVLRRALTSAGVPATVRLEEMPLVDQPAVRPLLTMLELAAGRRELDPPLALDLLGSPYARADALALRRLRQELRRHELASGGGRPSSELLVEALDDPGVLVPLDPRAVAPARRIADMLAAARGAVEAPGATAETVLWSMWSTSRVADRWARRAGEGGPGAATADRDLDAVTALFDTVARFVDRLPAAGPAVFLDHLLGQEIPGDTLAPRAPEGETVAVLTAHAAKGLEWDVVAVVGVQEGVWPDLRLRGSLLGSESLVDLVAGRDTSPVVTVSHLLAEERRLFYVAVTRCRRRLLVTAVSNEEAHPSRFLDELVPWSGPGEERPITRVPRGLDLAAVVAELRSIVCAPPAHERGSTVRLLLSSQTSNNSTPRTTSMRSTRDSPPRCAPPQIPGGWRPRTNSRGSLPPASAVPTRASGTPMHPCPTTSHCGSRGSRYGSRRARSTRTPGARFDGCWKAAVALPATP